MRSAFTKCSWGRCEMVKPWNTKGVEGVYRFLGRVWRLFVDEKAKRHSNRPKPPPRNQATRRIAGFNFARRRHQRRRATPAQLKTLHACIKKVTEDLDGLRFNTAISAMMVFVNEAMTWQTKPLSVLQAIF